MRLINVTIASDTAGLSSAYQLTEVTAGASSIQDTAGGLAMKIYTVPFEVRIGDEMNHATDEQVRRSLKRSVSRHAEIWQRLASL